MESDMKYKVDFTKKALKQLKKIQIQSRIQIFSGIKNLENSETWGDVRKLVNHKYDYRLRVGIYRVLFNVKEEANVVVNELSVEEVKKRDERTY